LSSQELTEQVTLKYLSLRSAEIKRQESCYEVLAPLECAKELEGLPYPNKNQYRFSFKPCPDPEVEVIRAGSSRLERIVGSIRKNSFLVKAFFSGLQLTPGLLVNFKIAYLTDQRAEELLLLHLNLVTGEIKQLTAEEPATWGEARQEPDSGQKIQAQAITYEAASEKLCSHVRELALARDQNWARSARIRWREAIRDLEAHYQRALREHGGEEKTDERQRRLRELEMRFRPRILAIPLSFALVYTESGSNVTQRP
jgi:hypothetical protein